MAALVMHYPDMLRFRATSPYITRMREAMAERVIAESEVLAWASAVRRSFAPPKKALDAVDTEGDRSKVVVDLLKRQSEQIELLILENTRLEDRLQAVEAQLRNAIPGGENITSAHTTDALSNDTAPAAASVVRSKKKGSQSQSATWYECFTAEPRVYTSTSVTKAALYEFRHMAGFMMLFLPNGFMLDAGSPAFKAEVLSLGEQAQVNTIDFVKASGSFATACGTVMKVLRQLQKNGKLDAHIAQFHERVDRGDIVGRTPNAANAFFIRIRPSL
jgi:hypothetical protein